MKKYRWILISLILWGLIWAGALSMRSLSLQTHKELAATPLPIKPELEEVQPKNPSTKVELYRDELKADKNERYLPAEAERSERVQMAWKEVYKKEGEEADVGETLNKNEGGEERTIKYPSNSTKHISTSKETSSSVNTPPNVEVDTAMLKKEPSPESGFHTQVIRANKNKQESRAIKAIIYGEQEIRSGGAVKLKTEEPMEIEGETLPAGTMLIGTSKKGKRLFIEIKQLSMGGKLQSVSLSCLDASDMQVGLIIQKPSMEEKMREEIANAATDEALSQIPVGGGVLRSGKRLIQEALSGKNKGRITLPHGYEIIITP